MTDPVFLTSGNTYEREAVIQHFSEKGPTDPISGEEVNPDFIIENKTLKKSIENFKANN
jgi:hypothetical protein